MTSRPRVLVVSTPPEMGGGEIHVQRLVEGLGGAYEFVVMTQLAAFRASVAGSARTWPVYGMVKFHGTWNVRLFRLLLPWYWLQYFAAFLVWRPALVHVQSNEDRLAVAGPAALLGLPVIWTVHGELDTSGSRYYARAFAAAAVRASAVVCVTEFVKASAVGAGVPAARCTVIPNGVDTGHFSPPPSPGAVVTFVGRLEAVKDPELFVSAALRVLGRCPDARFCVAGDGSLMRDLERLVATHTAAGRIRLVGWVEDSRAVLRESSMLVVTSVTEGQGIAALEAMSMAVPVIATNAGGLAEVVADGVTGVLLRERSPDAVASAIEALLADPARRAAMGRAARERVQRLYDVSVTNRRTAELYERVVAGRNTPDREA